MTYFIQGEEAKWEVVVGLEVHAQVNATTKLFSGSSAAFGSEQNSQVSLIDAAMPGMLPVINKHCVSQAIRSGLGLNAKINLTSIFERKNYFYADLPQGYQISQYQAPIVGEGTVNIELEDGEIRQIGIERLHMEQDAGKSMHNKDRDCTFIDLNRAGICLMEIVSKPEIRSPKEAGEYVRKVRSILRYLGTCDGNMEEGSLRADVNVSVKKIGEEKLRTRTETKNINSIRFIIQAVEVEAKRQVEVWESGNEVVQETRLLDLEKGQTRAMRSKEFAHDYRYFPDPDLLPLELTLEDVDVIRNSLPELPDEKQKRFVKNYGLSTYDARILVTDREVADYFEEVAQGRDGKLVANWITGTLFGTLNRLAVSIEECPISASNLGALIDLLSDGVISGRIAKDVFDRMLESGETPKNIVEKQGLKQITNLDTIESVVEEVIAENPSQAEQIKNGNLKAIGWFVGQVMKATNGTANPKMVNELVRRKLRN